MSSHESNALGNPAQTAPPVAAPTAPAAAAPVKKILRSLSGFRWWIILMTLGFKYAAMALTYCPPPTGHSPVACRALPNVFFPAMSVMSGFFVLAGFVLTWQSRPGVRKRDWYQSRFAKIYPLFVLSVLVDILLEYLHNQPTPSVSDLLEGVFLVQTWFNKTSGVGVNPVTWTLCCMAFFYACFPFLEPALARLRTNGLRAALGFFLIWPAIVALVFYVVDRPGFHDVMTIGWLFYMFPLTRVSEFALGIALALLVRRGAWVGPNVTVALSLLVGAYAVAVRLMPDMGGWASVCGQIMAPLFVLMIGALAIADLNDRWTPMRGRYSVSLGVSSYAFYLFHLFVLRELAPHFSFDSTPKILLYILCTAPVAILLAVGLHHLVETPIQRLLRPKRRPVPPMVS